MIYLSQSPPAALGDLIHLTRVDLEGAFTSLPNEITLLTNLKKLQIVAPIRTFPEGFEQLTKLDSLSICTRGEIPSQIGNMTNLVALDIGHNYLDQLPDLRRLTNLTDLASASNNLTEVPQYIFNTLTNLESLELTLNKLKEIPPSITKLRNLTSLRMAYNALTDLPDMETMTNLEVISMGGNPLQKMPINLLKLTGLERLDISKAGLRIIPSELTQLSKLLIFACFQNNIEVFLPRIRSSTRTMIMKASKFPPPRTGYEEFLQVNEDLYCT